MKIKDRIKELRRVKARELKPNPANWRMHPKEQQNALRGILAEVGIADAVIARELPDGSLQLIDGHLRAETMPDAIVPVLVTDLDDDEAAKVLATLDPLAAMAEADGEKLVQLLDEIETESRDIKEMMEQLRAEVEGSRQAGEDATVSQNDGDEGDGDDADVDAEDVLAFFVKVSCRDEDHQRELMERFRDEGLECQPLIF